MSKGWLYYPNMIDEVVVDVIESSSHNLSAEATENTLETGSKISEHVILKPRTLSVRFAQMNATGGVERATSVWGQFKDLWQNRTLLNIITEHDVYDNMIIEGLSALEVAPFKGALQCTLSLKQINFVNLQYVLVPEGQLPDWRDELDKWGITDFALLGTVSGPTMATAKTASSAINGGSQSGAEVTQWRTIVFGETPVITPVPPSQNISDTAQDRQILDNQAALQARGIF